MCCLSLYEYHQPFRSSFSSITATLSDFTLSERFHLPLRSRELPVIYLLTNKDFLIWCGYWPSSLSESGRCWSTQSSDRLRARPIPLLTIWPILVPMTVLMPPLTAARVISTPPITAPITASLAPATDWYTIPTVSDTTWGRGNEKISADVVFSLLLWGPHFNCYIRFVATRLINETVCNKEVNSAIKVIS